MRVRFAVLLALVSTLVLLLLGISGQAAATGGGGSAAAPSVGVAHGAVKPQIACGSGFTLALKADGSLWSWGQNAYGQLGLGDTASRSDPTRVGNGTDWIAVAPVPMIATFLSASLLSTGLCQSPPV